MRWIIIILLLVGSAFGTDIYYDTTAQGLNNGTSCANAYAYNDGTNGWSLAGKQGPDVTTHICPGIHTFTAGTTALTVNADGTSGHPYTIKFESGATLSAPYWPGDVGGCGGAINVCTHSFVNVIGADACGWVELTRTTTACTGVITATANGKGLANQTNTIGIAGTTGHDILIKNIGCTNLITWSAGGTGIDYSNITCVFWSGGSNVTIESVSTDYAGWNFRIDADNTIIRTSDIHHYCHGANPNGVNWKVYGNHFYDSAVYDTDNNACHEDGIHCYGNQTSTAYAYNNRFDGTFGQNYNQPIFLEGGDSLTKCFVDGGTIYGFNNLMVSDLTSGQGSNFGVIPQGGTSTCVTSGLDVSNLRIANSVGGATPQGSVISLIPDAHCPNSTATVENNAASGWGNAWNMLVSTKNTVDYNATENCNSVAGCWIQASNGYSTLASWIAATLAAGKQYDTHSIANPGASANAYFLLGASCLSGSVGADCKPTSSSPLRAAGPNLFSTCNGQPDPGLGAMCKDITGVARPNSAWDIGPYQFLSTPVVSLSTSTLAFGNQTSGTTSAAMTVTLTNTGGATLNISGIAIVSGTIFVKSATTCSTTLAASASCTVSVTFSPIAVTSYTGTLRFTSDASSSPDDVALTGTGVAAVQGGASTRVNTKFGVNTKVQ